MKKLRFLFPCLLMLAVGCKKDDNASAPTKTALLTAVTWRDQSSSLFVNGVEGTRPTAAADVSTSTRPMARW